MFHVLDAQCFTAVQHNSSYQVVNKVYDYYMLLY